MRAAASALAAAVVAGCAAAPARVAPPLSYESRSAVAVDHKPWDDFLATYVSPGPDGVARVAYDAVADADRRALDFYIARQSQVRVDALSRPEQFAFWANLHNAAVVAAVLDDWPIARFADIDLGQGWFRRPRETPLIVQQGRRYALDDIRSRVLQPLFRDARVHMALSTAAVGDPDLGPRAIVGEDLDAQLTDAARRFVNHPRGAAPTADGAIAVSPLFLRHEEDFGDLRAWLARYAIGPLAAALAADAPIVRAAWDDRLNALTPSR